MFVCAVNVIPWDTSYIIPGLPLTVSLQNLKFALPQVGDLCHDSAFFFTSFQSLSLSLMFFFCCLVLWRNGPEMQRIGYGDRDRGWDCDWGFTWLQNKLIQNQQETKMKQTTRWGMQRQKQWLRRRRRLRWRLRQGRQVAGGRHCRRSLRGAARSRWSSSVRPDDNTWVSISISSNTQ